MKNRATLKDGWIGHVRFDEEVLRLYGVDEAGINVAEDDGNIADDALARLVAVHFCSETSIYQSVRVLWLEKNILWLRRDVVFTSTKFSGSWY